MSPDIAGYPLGDKNQSITPTENYWLRSIIIYSVGLGPPALKHEEGAQDQDAVNRKKKGISI